MRTNIDIPDRLLDEAIAASGHKTKRAAVIEGLELLIRVKRQGDVKALFGQLHWQGSLDAMRKDR